MSIRRTGLLLLAAGAVGGFAMYRTWSPVELEFTRAAPSPLPSIELRAPVSTVDLALPLDLERVAKRMETALHERLSMGLDQIDPACGRRPSSNDCNSARLEGTLLPAGPARANASPGMVNIQLPLKFETGAGSDRTSIDTILSFAWRIQLGQGGQLDVTRIEQATIEGTGGPHARALRPLEARLKPLGLSVQDELRSVLSQVPVGAAAEQVWHALSQPIDLGAGTWLRSTPEVVGTGEITALNKSAVVRIPIAARLTIETGERPPAAPRRAVVHGQVNTTGASLVRIATPVGLEPQRAAIDAAFVRGGVLETRPDRFGPPVKVEVKRTRLYPSLRSLAVELDIAASRFEGQVHVGKAHISGRPVLDAERKFITLADINLLPAPPRESGLGQPSANAPRLAADPFTGKLAGAFRIDIGREVAEVLPLANSMLQRRISDQLTMSTRLETATPVSFEVVRDGGWLITDLGGRLAFVYEAAPQALPAPQQVSAQTSSNEPARKLATPLEPAAAAVVSAATVAGVATKQAVRPAAGGAAMPTATAIAPPLAPVTSTTPSPAPSVAAPAPSQTKSAASKVKPAVPRRGPGNNLASTGRREWIPFPTNN